MATGFSYSLKNAKIAHFLLPGGNGGGKCSNEISKTLRPPGYFQ